MHKIGLLGCGVVGGGVLNLLKSDDRLSVKTILDLRDLKDTGCILTNNIEDIINDPEIDIVVETMGGDRPAYDFVTRALRAGKHAVSSNKLLVAAHYQELVTLAKENGVAFRCTAAVGGGIPWLTNLGRAAAKDEILSVGGIMNGTTNYILDKMTREGCAFADVLAEAQKLGYAEANPAADIDGLDIRRKINISANIAFGVLLNENDIPAYGIRGITADDIACFTENGLVVRMIGKAEPGENGIAASVLPTLFKQGVPETAVHDNFNRISYTAKNLGSIAFYGQGAGRYPTAMNVVTDALDIAGGIRSFYTDKMVPANVDTSKKNRYYITLSDKAAAEGLLERPLGSGYITKPVTLKEIAAMCSAVRFLAVWPENR